MSPGGALAADRLETIAEISRVVSATLDLNILYDTIYQQIGRVMDSSQFFIALHRADRTELEIPYIREDGRLSLDQSLPYGGNITSLVIETGTPLLFHTDDDYERFAAQHGLETGYLGGSDTSAAKIYVPLNTGSRTIGTLTVQSTRPFAYSDDDVQTLSVIAAQAAVAIVNARLYAESVESVKQTEALLSIAQMINNSLNQADVLDAILRSMRGVVPYFFASILMPDNARAELRLVGVIGPLTDDDRRTLRVPFGQGVTGTVFRTGQPMIVPDVRDFPGYIASSVDGVRSEMAVPLKRGDSIIGVLNVESDQVNGFTIEDPRVLTLFASQAAIALENARLLGAQQQRVYELQTIESIVQKLTPLHDVPAIADLIDSELKQLIDFHACRLFVLDPRGRSLRPINADAQDIRLRIGEGLAGWIAEHGEAVIVPNALVDPRPTQIAGTPLRQESLMGAPLIYEDRVRGVITLSKLGIDQFDENSLRLLEIIAAQAAIAFDRARLYDELRTQAITDDLTQVYNRRYLLERLGEERSRAIRNDHALAAIMLDIDKFKRVNDSFGHDAGDIVLRVLALLIRGAVRAEDIVSRYGGEEFCILLPEIPGPDVLLVAERLCRTIAEHSFPGEAGIEHITVSVGAALLEPQDEGSELITRADLAMYQVKRHGGNGVCLAEGSDYSLAGQQAG